MKRTLRLARGDLALCLADALATSSNCNLSGNANPSNWRFNGRRNVDAAVRAAGGPALTASSCAALEARGGRLLEPGSAVATRAGGELRAAWVIHAVAPDAMYGGEAGANAALLRKTYRSVLQAAGELGARSLVVPALGCGVQGFRPAIAAREAFAVAAEWLEGGSEGPETGLAPTVEELMFVCFADDVWTSWPACAGKWLGPPHATEAGTEEGAGVSAEGGGADGTRRAGAGMTLVWRRGGPG
jgi:O-acetyl-ADP-ribose deacetylase (regulator of RNase III)